MNESRIPFVDSELTRLVIEASPAGMLITDAAGNVMYVNSQAESLFGYSREELVGHPVETLVPSAQRNAHVRDRTGYMAQATSRSMARDQDLYALRKDGSVLPVDISLHPLETEQGTMILANILDATDRKHAEVDRKARQELHWNELRQELRNSESRMRFMVENLPAGAVYVDHDELFFNRAVQSYIGYTPDEIKKTEGWFDVLCPTNADEQEAAYHQARDGDFAHRWGMSIVRNDGGTRQLELAGFRYDHHEVWVVSDVTELELTQRKLVQSERLAAIGEMVTGLAHESRNALQRARACLELLELDIPDGSEQLQLTGRIRRALHDLQRHYEEVKTYAAPIVLNCQSVSLLKLCEAAFEDLACESQGADHRMTVETRDKTIARVDPHRIKQVFRNLLENAIAAAPGGANIGVTATDARIGGRPAVEIHITDQSGGLSPEASSRLFEPFFTTKQHGTGLGLAICRRIVDAHEGSITAENNSPHGTTVSVAVPTHG